MTAKKVKKELSSTALDNKCPGCRAVIKFNPKLNKWKCEYCDSEFSIEEMDSYNKSRKEKNDIDLVEDDSETYITYKCPDCGAEIIADEQTSATFCVYCGNTAILKNKLVGKFEPNFIIPFKIDKDVAVEKFKNLAKGRLFVPKDFTDEKNIEKIRGVYIPFWLFGISVDGNISFNATTSTSWTSGDYRYTKTDFYLLSRELSVKFKRVPVDASTRFDNKLMNSIEPFDYKDMVPYNHSYLSGFYAEKYDIGDDGVWNEPRQRALSSARDLAMNDARNTGKLITSIKDDQLKTKEEKHEYALLPVWMVNVKYKDKYYMFAMNGQTGEFIGNIPLDKKKMWKYGIGMFIDILLIIFIGSIIVFLLGGGHF